MFMSQCSLIDSSLKSGLGIPFSVLHILCHKVQKLTIYLLNELMKILISRKDRNYGINDVI